MTDFFLAASEVDSGNFGTILAKKTHRVFLTERSAYQLERERAPVTTKKWKWELMTYLGILGELAISLPISS